MAKDAAPALSKNFHPPFIRIQFLVHRLSTPSPFARASAQ